MRRLVLFLTGLLMGLMLMVSQSTVAQEANTESQLPKHTFFDPVRPKAAKLYTAIGILDGWGYGNSSGGICIKPLNDHKRRCFFTPIGVFFNGTEGSCAGLPECKKEDMGAGFEYAKTKVKVTYWFAPKEDIGGKQVEVTDQVDSLP